MSTSSRIALVTGATQGLGRSLVAELAARLETEDVVYLTGRDEARTNRAAAEISAALPGGSASIRPALLDVTNTKAPTELARSIAAEHGGIDIVVNNAVMRVNPDDDVRQVVADYVDVNNFGTTRMMRAFAPILRDGGRFLVVASSLGTLDFLAPVLHHVFRGLDSLEAVDKAIAGWRNEVESGATLGSAWPGFINIPSKIGQVAAVRALAESRRDHDTEHDILITAVCPGMINTPTSGAFWDVSDAPTPDQAAEPIVDLVLGTTDPALYGQLSRAGTILRFDPAAAAA